jgi:hypothetical protein
MEEHDLERLKKTAANSPIQKRIKTIQSVEDLGKFMDEVRRERTDVISGLSLEQYLEALSATCARARANRKLRGDELPDPPQWSDVADLLYTAMLYE